MTNEEKRAYYRLEDELETRLDYPYAEFKVSDIQTLLRLVKRKCMNEGNENDL